MALVRRWRVVRWRLLVGALAVAIGALALVFATRSSGPVIVRPRVGPPPSLMFACCDGEQENLSAALSDTVIGQLKMLGAGVAVATIDFSPARAGAVRRLDEAGVPVEAWLVLPSADGSYFSADRVAEAAARYTAFAEWTAEQHLTWTAVGLDIEPNPRDFDSAHGRTLGLLRLLMARFANRSSVAAARAAYRALIARVHADGHAVHTYQMPLIAADRGAHSTVLQRLTGIVDVRSDEEALMLYTSAARAIGPGMIWALGSSADAIAVGVTAADAGTPPLSWDEFSRDLRLANHFTSTIGVYNLEGAVSQGFLPKLAVMDWTTPVAIPRMSADRAIWLGRILRVILRVLQHVVAILVALAIVIVTWGIRRRRRVR